MCFVMISYDKFRTGLTFQDIRDLLKLEQDAKYAEGKYMFVTRKTVLGRWHEIKLRMYSDEEKAYGEYTNG